MTGSKPPPHDQHAERSLLGAAMLAPAALEVLASDTDPENFYVPAHGHIAAALRTMWLQGNVKVDPVLLADELKRNGLLEQCGGLPELVSIMGNTPATSNAGRYAAIVRGKARHRRLITTGTRLTAAARAEDENAEREALRLIPTPSQGNEAEAQWPTLEPSALHGLAGEVVRTIQPHTEADPAAVLVSFLASFGAALGRGPHAIADGAEHPPRLNALIVGQTSKARKGSSWQNVRRILAAADAEFVRERVLAGFGSGEALVDAVSKEDRRLLVLEPEFARILNVGRREGATLSSMIRQAWDGDRLQVRSRSGTAVADDAHVVVLGHITVEELRAKLTETEVASGFANRFLVVCVRRSKLLPSGGNLDDELVEQLGRKVAEALSSARQIGRLRRTAEADDLWSALYDEMAHDEPPGLLGAVIARDAAQVLRLSVTYALLDGARFIDVAHLRAAWSLWRYARASAALVFGGALGNPVADRLLEAITTAGPQGLTRSQMHEALGGHRRAGELDVALARLTQDRLVVTEEVQTGGRPRQVTRPALHCEESELSEESDPSDPPPGLSSPSSLNSPVNGSELAGGALGTGPPAGHAPEPEQPSSHQATSEDEDVGLLLAAFEGAHLVGDRLADDGGTW